MKKLLVGLMVLGVGIALPGCGSGRPEVHYHAGFQVYIDNELQDFSSFKFMNLRPCDEEEDHHDLSPEEAQLEKGHLHDGVGDVVHVHLDGAAWGDLFENIGFELPGEATAYVDGELYEGNILEKSIVADESVVFFVGENADIEEKLAGRVGVDWIKEVEGMSETCGD